MTKEHAEFFQKALDYCGEECEIKEDYSGRGMFGKTTYGIVFAGPTILMESVLTYIKETEVEYEDIPDLASLRSDNMGMSIIWY